jgi:RimJ/RimL family protein N-acetyltransferase
MTDKSINRIIRRLNTSVASEVIRRQIGENVWWGYAWGTKDQGYNKHHVQEEGYEMFFIKADDGKFAAAVHRMLAGELHWYVTPKYRGKGLLIKPLKEVILPFIFATYHWDSQRGTLDPHRKYAVPSAKVAERVGFKHVSDTDEGKRETVKKYNPFGFPPATEQDLVELRNRVPKLARQARMLFDQVRVRFSNRINKEKLEYVEHEIDSFTIDLIDIIEDARYSVKAETEPQDE